MLPFYITGCDSDDPGKVTSVTATNTEESISVGDTVLDDSVAEEVDGLDDPIVAEVDGLDTTETSHLTFMREEEKLARDVYLTLSDLYPDQRVFSQIATRAEQTHTDTMRDKLDQFNLPDPNPNTCLRTWPLYFRTLRIIAFGVLMARMP